MSCFLTCTHEMVYLMEAYKLSDEQQLKSNPKIRKQNCGADTGSLYTDQGASMCCPTNSFGEYAGRLCRTNFKLAVMAGLPDCR